MFHEACSILLSCLSYLNLNHIQKGIKRFKKKKNAEVQMMRFAKKMFWDPNGQIGDKSGEYRCVTTLACSILGGSSNTT